jgi:CheY-like chemotaxis protein
MISEKKQILCVEDDPDTSGLISFVLGNYRVTDAHRVAEALRRAHAEKFDLYLLDYHLPDGTGIELCLMLRAFDRDTPVLFVTGTSSISETQVIIAGAQGLIRKNTSFVDELRVRVSQLITF